MPAVSAEVGSTANHYQILARLAVGGMAEIFLARGMSSAGVERYCVLKRILRDRASDLHFVRMFLDEARLVAQLNHPNVAQVYDIGKLADSYFFTMEFVHGETVRSVMQRARSLRRELPLGAVLTIMAGAAAGLHHAHERLGLDGRPLGIVHRDVSPSNLMISFEGGVKVVDFGVAKAADRISETRAGTVKGKISYLSPEQCRGTEVDRRTDLFALGIVMWEMLTLERLYRRASDFENMNAIVNEPTPAPSTRRPAIAPPIPPALDALVLRLLAKDPADRFQTADEVIEALEQIAAATGTMISSSSLGRLLREMFGQRPEPWLEMDPQEAPEGVTVTSEPIPPELGDPILDSVDLQLAAVPDLSPRGLTTTDGTPPPMAATASAREQLTAQLRMSRSKGSDVAAPVDLAPPLPPPPTQPVQLKVLAAPAEPGSLPLPAPPATVSEAALDGGYPVPAPNAQALTRPDTELDLRHSGPLQPIAVAGSGGHALPDSGRHSFVGADSGAPAAQAVVALPDVPEKPARGWPMIAVILAATVIGSLTVLLVMKTGGGSRTDVVSMQVQAPVAGPAVAPAGSAVAPAGSAAASAGLIVTPIDPDAPAAPTAPTAPPRTLLESAINAQRYDDAVAICAQQLTPATAAACTLAACHARLAPRARAWFQRVPATERPTLTNLCRSLGIDPVPPRRAPPPKTESAEDKCERDPMACQH